MPSGNPNRDEDGDARSGRSRFTADQRDELRELWRREWVENMAQIGLDVSTVERRQEFASTWSWVRAKKAGAEAIAGKFLTAIAGAVATAVVTAAGMYIGLKGGHS